MTKDKVSGSTEQMMPTEGDVHDVLRRVIDPELGLNVEDLGLVYGVTVEPGRVCVHMTMTTPACPMGSMITEDAREQIRAISPAEAVVEVALVWEPPWTPERMSAEARSYLGWEP